MTGDGGVADCSPLDSVTCLTPLPETPESLSVPATFVPQTVFTLRDMKRLSFVLILVTTVSLTAQTVLVAPATPVSRLVQSLVDGAPADLQNVYGPAAYQPLW